MFGALGGPAKVAVHVAGTHPVLEPDTTETAAGACLFQPPALLQPLRGMLCPLDRFPVSGPQLPGNSAEGSRPPA